VTAGAVPATGIALGALVLWSRDPVLHMIETVTARLAMPLAFLALVLVILALQGAATYLLIGRDTAGPPRR
jgi:hypothetical protein